MNEKLKWVEEPRQKAWAWIAVVFAAFYFGEAFLFWSPNPRVNAPPFTPLLYWGAFGITIIWLLSRKPKTDAPGMPSSGIPDGLQTAILGTGVTASVIGMAFVVIRVTGNVTLGHVILLGALFEAAVVIGGMSVNPGWLGAGLVWVISAVLVARYPRVQDYTLGAAMVAGFALIGSFRWSLRTQGEIMR